jgi:hypothetical protein
MANRNRRSTITGATKETSASNAEARGWVVSGAQQEAVRQLSKCAA